MKRLTALSTFASLALLACDNPVDIPVGQPVVVAHSIENTLTGDVLFGTSAVFPNTNDINFNKTSRKWAHVLLVDVAVGQVTLNFVSSRTFASCFEYRIDDEAPTSTANGGNNSNPLITDGMWLFTCQSSSNLVRTFTAQQYVDIRMGFGAEEDERFDWTRFYVPSLENLP